MAEFVSNGIKAVGPGEDTGARIPSKIATIKFDVYYPGKYIVTVDEDGTWMAQEYHTYGTVPVTGCYMNQFGEKQ